MTQLSVAELKVFSKDGEVLNISWGDRVTTIGEVPSLDGTTPVLQCNAAYLTGISYTIHNEKGLTFIGVGLYDRVECWYEKRPNATSCDFNILYNLGDPGSLIQAIQIVYAAGHIVEIRSTLLKKVVVSDSRGTARFREVLENAENAVNLDNIVLDSKRNAVRDLNIEVDRLRSAGSPEEQKKALLKDLVVLCKRLGFETTADDAADKLTAYFRGVVENRQENFSKANSDFNDWRGVISLPYKLLDTESLAETNSSTKAKLATYETQIQQKDAAIARNAQELKRLSDKIKADARRCIGRDYGSADQALDDLFGYVMPRSADDRYKIDTGRTGFCMALLEKIKRNKAKKAELDQRPSRTYPTELENEVITLRDKWASIQNKCKADIQSLKDEIARLDSLLK